MCAFEGHLEYDYIRVQDQRKFQMKQSYWPRAKSWIQGVYLRVQDWSMEEEEEKNAKMAPLSHQMLATQLNRITSPNWETNSTLDSKLEARVNLHERVLWTPSFFGPDPNVNSPLQ